MDDLVVGGVYIFNARNFRIGLWSGSGFIGCREKFGHLYLDEEYPYDDGGTVHNPKRIGSLTVPETVVRKIGTQMSSSHESSTVLAILQAFDLFVWGANNNDVS